MKFFSVLAIASVLSFQSFAQKKAPDNWFNLDAKNDKVWGVSSDKAYKELPIGKNPVKIIVAVIDAGTDIYHEDLKMNLWVNTKEIPGNGIDDDKNGYIDDINGWNFIGGKEGNVKEDTYEFTRILGAYIQKGYDENDIPPFKVAGEEDLFIESRKMQKKESEEINGQYEQFKTILKMISDMTARTGSKDPSVAQVDALKVETKQDKGIKSIVKYIAKTGGTEKSPIMIQFKEAEEQLATMVNYNLNLKFNPRNLVGDNYEDVNERYYGNNQIDAPTTDHGTHVAGIIAANRYNDLGIKGICGEALIMTLRVVPNGDERDKDIANAIRYAADNGAKVINMSFGKKLSPNKNIVDEAVKYAMSKDVLMVHAAGNDGEDLSISKFYPMPKMLSGETAPNWIEVGASGWQKGKNRVASFTNYNKESVEIFAPGVDINSTMPGNKYKSQDGTSMASPVVAGVAALVRQNYPSLSSVQTKQILLMSAAPCKEKVIRPGTKEKTKLSELCVTGGIVNAYAALVLADKVVKGEVKLP
ncbi:MAG: S8 family peptidase [bacterium]|nr:S8 family peptidase [bacterium]